VFAKGFIVDDDVRPILDEEEDGEDRDSVG
jgi:hypothetical protein